MIHRAAAIATALKLSALMAFSDRAIQPVSATDLRLNVVREQDGMNARVPIDKEFTFYCGRAADLDKSFSDIALFETKIGEDGHPRCLDVEDEVAVVAYHPVHGYDKKTVAVGSIRGGQQDVVIALGRPEQDLTRRDLKSFDIVKLGYFEWDINDDGASDTITITPEDVPTYELGSKLGIGVGKHLEDCVIDDIDVQVTVTHTFLEDQHVKALIHDGTTEFLGGVDDTGADYFDVTAAFEEQSALGDWTLGMDIWEDLNGGFSTWALFINCKTKLSSLLDILFKDHPEDAPPPKTVGRPLPGASEEPGPRFSDCLDGQELTIDSYKTMDDATKECIRAVWAGEQDEMASEGIEALDAVSMSMP